MVRLSVVDAAMRDCVERVARLPGGVMSALGLRPGDPVLVRSGARVVVLRAWPFEPRGGGGASIGLCRFHREALGVRLGDVVEVEPVSAPVASRVVLAPLPGSAGQVRERRVVEHLRGKPVGLGEIVVVPGSVPPARLAVVDAAPRVAAVTVGADTVVEVRGEPAAELVALTGEAEWGSLACQGRRLGDGMVLLVEPGPCAWVWRGTRVERITPERLLELLASSGLVARGLSALLRGEEPSVSELLALLALLIGLSRRAS